MEYSVAGVNRVASRPYGQPLYGLLAGAFFVSGFSALLYQVVWQRLLGLFAGSDVRSVTIVIGAYLAGLGVGSLLGSFYADRLNSRQAVRLFGLCNLGIAIFAFLSRFLFYDLLFIELNTLAKFPALIMFIVFVSLLWPTSLMGLSLPLLAKALTKNVGEAAGLIGLLYGVNTFGAGIGSLLTGWYLIGTLGYEVTVYVGGLLSLVVGLFGLAIAPQLKTDNDQPAPAKTLGLSLKQVPHNVWGWCLFVFTSGFIAISFELVWFRILDVLLQSNAYTFGHFLTFILVGYALGSLCGARLLKWIKHPRRAFLWIQGLVVLYSLVVIGVIAWTMRQGWLEPYLAVFTQDGGAIRLDAEKIATAWRSYVLGYLVLPGVILLPPNFLIGFYFPITQQAVQTDANLVGQRVGLMQVANIMGNTAGSILTGLVLLHFWGTSGTLRIIGLLGLLLALTLVWEDLGGSRRSSRPVERRGLLASGVLVVLLLLTMLSFPGTTQLWSWLHRAETDSDLFIVAEDSSGVTALQERAGQAHLSINGQGQGAIPYLSTHSYLGAVGAILHPDPERVLVIGIGSGGTPYNAGVNPNTDQVLAVEIVGSVLTVLEAYAQEPGGLPLRAFFDNERYDISVGDGRRALALSEAKFDIIEADAIYPWRSGSGFLYSREFFEAARAKLTEDGLMVQWAPTPRIQATFLSVFPYVVTFDNKNILIGSNHPILLDRQALIERVQNPAFMTHWQRGGVDPNIFQVATEGTSISVWTPATPRDEAEINTDLFPKDEYYLNN